MRLRTFESFWLLKNGLLYTYPSLQKNIDTEIVVVGAGITGALVSHALIEKGYKVLLLDKRDVAMGSSSATTSMLQYEIDVPLHKLSKMIGEAGAVQCYQAGISAIDELEKLVKTYQVDCGFQAKKSLYIAHNNSAAKDLRTEFEIRSRHNLGVNWLSSEEVEGKYGMKSFGGIVSRCGASVDAYKLAHELIQLNTKRGLEVYDQTEIEKFHFKGKHPVIEVNADIQINCRKVIFCTGYETTTFLKEDVARLFYTYACVSETGIEVMPELKNTLVWNTETPYLYLRTTDDGRLLVGGEDSSYKNSFLQQKIKEKKAGKLIQRLEKMIPGINFITDFTWAGVFGSTKDGLPYIGASPEYNNALFVLGFGGNGITFSAQAMDLIPKMLEGESPELARYYAFGR